MASENYTHGEMDVQNQQDTWESFLTFSTWGGLITILVVGYATLTIATGMNWMIALGLMAAFGFLAGYLLKLGGRWTATMIGMVIIALVVQGTIALFGMFLG